MSHGANQLDLARQSATYAVKIEGNRGSSLPTLARFGLSGGDPTAVRPALAACREDFVSAIGSIINEARAKLVFAALPLTSP
jgi:hypothetical protein